MTISTKYHLMCFMGTCILMILFYQQYMPPLPLLLIGTIVVGLGIGIYLPSTGAKLPLLTKVRIDSFWTLFLYLASLIILFSGMLPERTDSDKSTFISLLTLAVFIRIGMGIWKVKNGKDALQ